MKKRLFAFCAALLMLFCFTVPTFAIAVTPLAITVDDPWQESTTTWQDNVKEKLSEGLHAFSAFWHKRAVIIIVILLFIAIVTAVTISEFEQEKKRQENRPPEKKHKKK